MELGAVPIAVALSLETGLPFVMIRKEKREHGTGSQIEGALDQGDRVLIVEDVVTSGGSTIKSVEALREAGAKVDTAVVVVDREEGGEEALQALDVTLKACIKASQLKKE
jgi:orotate phosphoribosyltransferase